MSLRPELVQLLDRSRSEAKRWGKPSLDLLVLAATLARYWPEAFLDHFGESGKGKIEAALLRKESVGDEAAVDAALDSVNAVSAIPRLAAYLHSELGPVLGPEPELPPVPDFLQSAYPPPPGPNDELPAPPTAGGRSGDDLAPRSQPYLDIVVPADVIGRASVVDDVLAVIGRRQPRAALITSLPGLGRTAVLSALAARVADPAYAGPLGGRTVVRLKLDETMPDHRAGVLRRAVQDLSDGSWILAIDDLDVLVGVGSQHIDGEALFALRAALSGAEPRLVLTMDATHQSRLEGVDAELHDELVPVELSPLPLPVLETIALNHAAALTDFLSISAEPDVVLRVLAPRSRTDRRDHPALATERLDAAFVRARLRAGSALGVEDLQLTRSPDIAALDPDVIQERIESRVLGQPGAVETIASRLALTQARLDLRPERPDGVFLFVGPTGVGKTELARAICVEAFGDEDRLIRLDMSEYVHDWAVSRIIGPQPGYVGSTEPKSWLTTKVIECPDTVVLLDEIEKAHPLVWNTFLQVFDAGRLSDSRGEVADFSRTIVIMTSNMGADTFSSPALGFGGSGSPDNEARVRMAIGERMAPELINRLDAVVVFNPLAPEAIAAIAAKEITAVADRLALRGYQLSVDRSVVEYVAATGYDPAFGARHLHRNIERLLLAPLARVSERSLTAELVDGVPAWVPTPS